MRSFSDKLTFNIFHPSIPIPQKQLLLTNNQLSIFGRFGHIYWHKTHIIEDMLQMSGCFDRLYTVKKMYVVHQD